MLFKRPDWDFYGMDLTRDVEAAEAADVGLMATNPDLSAFEARGGKIIQYHGWADPFIPTENSINYYESVVAKQGGLEEAQAFHRLFLVPGMGHCNGAYAVDWIGALERWVEGGVAPERILILCSECHRKQHEGRIDVEPLLTTDEAAQAVADAGTIEGARVRLTPRRLREVAA